MYTKKQVIIKILITFLIAGIFGFFIGSSNQPDKEVVSEDLNPGLKVASERLLKRGHAEVVILGYGLRESREVGGNIKSINQEEIILKVNPINALADPLLDERIVKINKHTKFYKNVEKSSEELENDMIDFDKKMQEMSEDFDEDFPMPPDILKKEEISPDTLNLNDRILVIAEKNIHDKKEFFASEVILR